MEQHQENLNKAGEEETENASGNTFGWTTEDQAQYMYIRTVSFLMNSVCTKSLVNATFKSKKTVLTNFFVLTKLSGINSYKIK